MDELQAQVEWHNAQEIRLDIEDRVAECRHSLEVVLGLLDDLNIYLPKPATEAA
jgi:outer membrane protein TolC